MKKIQFSESMISSCVYCIFFHICKTSLSLRDKIVVIMSWRKKNDSFKKLKKLQNYKSLPGFEGQVRNHIRQKITPHVDRIETDGLGGIFGIKDTTVENAISRILVAAHMDEVGFMISQIKPDGTFRVVELWRTLWSFQVKPLRFNYRTVGPFLPFHGLHPSTSNTRGNAPGVPAIADIIFDAGFANYDEAWGFGVRPGDVLIPKNETILTANGKNVISKAWDNRFVSLW